MKVKKQKAGKVVAVKPPGELASGQCHPYEVGANYFVRTVTHHFTGRLVEVGGQELVLEDAAWIADSGRWMSAIATGSLGEVEPYPDGARVIVGRAGLVDAVKITWPLPRSQK